MLKSSVDILKRSLMDCLLRKMVPTADLAIEFTMQFAADYEITIYENVFEFIKSRSSVGCNLQSYPLCMNSPTKKKSMNPS